MPSALYSQRFVRPINSLAELVASNPNDPHTNVFIPRGPTGPGLFYQWRKNDAEATNANQSVLGSDWPGAVGRWHNIPIAQGAIDGISNSGTNGFAVVNTLADLRNVPGNLGIGMVYVRGHAQPDDWGRGFFSRLDDCSTPDDDAYSVHGNDALTCWKRENDLPWSGIPVQYFGGTITVATINRATAYLESIGGGAAFITDGAWLMDTTNGPIILRNSVTIAGSASAILVGDGYGTMFGGTNIHNAQILELGISNVVTGVLIRGGTNILIGGNSFFDVGEGVRQYGGDDVRIEVNRFEEGTNGIHLSLDGSVQVTQGALNGNTFSGMVNSNVLADVGSTDGYQRYDSGTDFRLAQKSSTMTAGTNTFYYGNPGALYLGDNALSIMGTPTTPTVSIARDVTKGDSVMDSTLYLEGRDSLGDYFAAYGYISSSRGGESGFYLNASVTGIEQFCNPTNIWFMGFDGFQTRFLLNPYGVTPGTGTLITPYLFDSSRFLTSGNLLEVFNNKASLSNALPRFSVGHSGYFQTLESTAPGTPPGGAGYWYANSTDSKPHYIADDGTDYDLTGGGTGPAFSDLVWTNNAGVVQLVGTNSLNIFPASGGIYVGPNTEAYWGYDPNVVLIAYSDANAGDPNYREIYLEAVGSGVSSVVDIFARTNQAVLTVMSGSNGLGVTGESGDTFLQLIADGVTGVLFRPGIADGSTPYTFDTSINHTSGNLLEVENLDVDKFTVGFDGSGTFAGMVTVRETSGTPITLINDDPLGGFFTGTSISSVFKNTAGTEIEGGRLLFVKQQTWVGGLFDPSHDTQFGLSLANNGQLWTALSIVPGAIALTPTSGSIVSNPGGTFSARVSNSTQATAGVPLQYSPSFGWYGTAWNTAALASQNVNFFSVLRPASGSQVSGELVFSSSTNNSAILELLKLKSTGEVSFFVGTKLYLDEANNVFISSGTGTPEGSLAGGVGSTFHRKDGGAGTTLYVKESGTGNTGWIGK